MSTNNIDNQEIDLSYLSNKIVRLKNSFLAALFQFILYLKKKILLFALLAILGYAVGYFIFDSNSKIYNHEVIVTPNFESTEYLYNKIEYLKERVSNKDTVFLKSIGLNIPTNIMALRVEPVVDVYGYINDINSTAEHNSQTFELLKLMAENGDVNKIITDDQIGKNYKNHKIILATGGYMVSKNTIEPIMNYLNKDTYFQKIQKTDLEQTQLKINANKTTLNQIDGMLNQFINASNAPKGDKLVYYNENSQLGDIIKSKNELVSENQYLQKNLVNLDKIIKEKSRVTNIKESKGFSGKMRYVVPLIFIFCYIMYVSFMAFYKKEASKLL